MHAHSVKNTGTNWVEKTLEFVKRSAAPIALVASIAHSAPAYAQMPANMAPPEIYTYQTHGRYEVGQKVYDVNVTLYCDGIRSGKYFLSGCLTDKAECVADPRPPNNCLSQPAVKHSRIDSIYMVNPDGKRTRIGTNIAFTLGEKMCRSGIMVRLPDWMYKYDDGVSIFVYPCRN